MPRIALSGEPLVRVRHAQALKPYCYERSCLQEAVAAMPRIARSSQLDAFGWLSQCSPQSALRQPGMPGQRPSDELPFFVGVEPELGRDDQVCDEPARDGGERDERVLDALTSDWQVPLTSFEMVFDEF